MKRTIKKQIWMTRDEAQDLKKKAKAACMTEARLMRMLLAGYAPPAAPDDRFYKAMDEINEFGDSIDRLAGSVNDPKTAAMLIKEAEKWHRLQAKIEKHYLSPERMDIKWQ
jgi:hypothetical protein